MVSCINLPFDLWHLFIGFACTDDGTTARSLSMTTRTLRELSKPFRYSTVTLIHKGQIMAFEKHISGIPVELRRVKNLFVSFYHQLGDEELEAFYRVAMLISPTLEILSIHDAPCFPLNKLLPHLPALQDLAGYRSRIYLGMAMMDRSRLVIREGTSYFPSLQCLHLEGYAARASEKLPLESLAPLLKRFYVSTSIFRSHLRNSPDFPISVEEIVVPITEEYKDAESIECFLLQGWCNLLPSEAQRLLYHPEGLHLSKKLRFTHWRYNRTGVSIDIWKADWLERVNGRVILRDRVEFPFPIEEMKDQGVQGQGLL